MHGDSENAYSDGLAALNESIAEAVSISDRSLGVVHTGRQNRALVVFAKLIAHSLSTTAIVDKYRVDGSFLDHFSLAALTRAIIDASLMVHYISHPSLNRDEWDLRRHVLFLHDLCNRRWFFKSLGRMDSDALDHYPQDEFKRTRAELSLRICTLAEALGYSEEQIEKLTCGQEVYIGGVRAAVREAGWDVDSFNFLQTYLSNWVHSYPVSFIRADAHQLSFDKPSEFQLGFCGLLFETSSDHLSAACERMNEFTGEMSNDPIGQVD